MLPCDRCEMVLKKFITETRWGAKSLVSLYVSVLTGLVLALQYEPATPFFSIGVIDVLVPGGKFWRSCHFYASQLFFLFSLIHLWAVLLAGTEEMPWRKWLYLIGSLPCALLLLFTGYVLRADATGEAAGIIAENITLSIPVVGSWLNSVLFSIEAEGMKRIYANHLIGLVVLWIICCWDHLRRYRVGFRQHGMLVAGMLLFCLVVMAPMEPARLGMLHIQGPWFFLGLQELLRYIPAFWAGVVFPSSVVIALGLVAFKESWRRPSLQFICAWLLVYTVLTIISSFR